MKLEDAIKQAKALRDKLHDSAASNAKFPAFASKRDKDAEALTALIEAVEAAEEATVLTNAGCPTCGV